MCGPSDESARVATLSRSRTSFWKGKGTRLVSVKRRSDMPSRTVSLAFCDAANCSSKDLARLSMPARRFFAISSGAPSAQKNLSSSSEKERRMPDAKRAPKGVGEVACEWMMGAGRVTRSQRGVRLMRSSGRKRRRGEIGVPRDLTRCGTHRRARTRSVMKILYPL